MSHRIVNLVYFILLIFFSLSIPECIYSQNKYGFDFDAQWYWEDLINKIVIINPELIKLVDSLNDEISIIDARILLKELSGLNSLNELSQLYEASLSDSKKNKSGWDSVLTTAFVSVNSDNDFNGLLLLALRLSKLRNSKIKNVFQFRDRAYLPQPFKDFKKNIGIHFDYSGAEVILDFFGNKINDMKQIYETVPYTIVLNDKSLNSISKEQFQNYLLQSSKNDTLFSIYKWLNPLSFWNMGGVSIYENNFTTVIENFKLNESNIKFDIEKNLSGYLPENILFDVDIMFLFGDRNPGWISGKNKLGINLEFFGDDYNYLKRFIQHQIFIMAEKQMRLPVEQYAVAAIDNKFVNVLSDILTNGTANYTSPVGTETRPWYLLEKDFSLFNKTFKNIYKKNNTRIADSLIVFGFSGDAPFVTMATQMAYIIETTLGRNALIEAIKYGSIYFFSRYIDAYKEYPDKIRKVFSFNKKLEKKIFELKKIFPQEIISDALKIKEYRRDTILFADMVSDFIKKYSRFNNDKLVDLLAGQLFLDAWQFNYAQQYFFRGISGKSNQGVLAGELGKLFSYYGSVNEALKFYDFYIENSKGDPMAYEIRGEYFYKLGDNEKALIDFGKALSINSSQKISKSYLEKINSE